MLELSRRHLRRFFRAYLLHVVRCRHLPRHHGWFSGIGLRNLPERNVCSGDRLDQLRQLPQRLRLEPRLFELYGRGGGVAHAGTCPGGLRRWQLPRRHQLRGLRSRPVPAEQRFHRRLVRHLPARPIRGFERFHCVHAVPCGLLHYGHRCQRVQRVWRRPVPSEYWVDKLRLVHRGHLQLHYWRKLGQCLRQLQCEYLLWRRRQRMLGLSVG